MMISNWKAALSLTVGVGLVAGCGAAPTVPTQKAPAATAVSAPATTDSNFSGGGLAAQVVDPNTATVGTTPTVGTMPGVVAAPSTMAPMPSSGGGGTGTAPAPVAAAPGGAMPGAPAAGAPGAMTPGAIGAPVPAISGTGVLGDTRLPPVVGVISKSLDRGLGVFAFAAGDLVAFQSNRAEGGGAVPGYRPNFDIFVYDALAQTVLALPGVNTPANETNPRLSATGEFLVYQTDETGYEQIRVFDLRNQLIDTLNTLNFPSANQSMPDISNDGNLIVYVSDQDGYGDKLRVYNTHNGANFIVPVANRGLNHITWPTISGNGDVIAYSARGEGENRQIFVYSLAVAAQLTPPFLNVSDADNYNPDLNLLGDRIVFVSNRRGTENIYMTDLKSGFTDNLVLANAVGRQQCPRFLGPDGARIVFQSDRTGYFRLYAYDLATALLDTLPVTNEIESDTQLRNVLPAIPPNHAH